LTEDLRDIISGYHRSVADTVARFDGYIAGQGVVRPQVQALRAGCNLPPVGETRFVPTELVLDIPSNVSTQILDDIAARHAMTRVETSTLRLTGRTLHRWSIDGGTSVADMIRNVCTNPTDRLVAGAQPNYLYALAQDQQEPVNSAQYAPEKLKLLDAHRLASGNKVLVAIIDSEVDGSHPDLPTCRPRSGPHPIAAHQQLAVAPAPLKKQTFGGEVTLQS